MDILNYNKYNQHDAGEVNALNSTEQKPQHLVALCISRIHGEAEQREYQTLRTQLQAHGYHLLVFNTFVNLYERDSYSVGERSVFSLIPYHLLEALIVVPETIKQEEVLTDIIAQAHAANIPVITLDKPIEGCYNIAFSYANTMEQIVRHVVEEHGCTRVNFIAGFKGNPFSEERLEAYKKVLKEHDIPIEENRIGYGDFWDIPTFAVVEKFLSGQSEPPQAIICANDTMAIATCAKLSEKGFQIPEDIIVTGFDGIEAERYHTPRLTTARLNLSGAAEIIMELLENLHAGRLVSRDYTVFHKITYSQSCGCRPKRVTNANEQVLSLYNQVAQITDFNHSMSRMISKLAECPFDEAIYRLRHYIDLLQLPAFSIYAARNYLSTDPEDKNIGIMTPTAVAILNKRDGSYTDTREQFDVSELAPDLDTLLTDDEALLILPIHFQDMVQAYMLIQLPDDFRNFDLLYILHMNLNQLMGLLHSQHSLQAAFSHMEKLYSHDYMTELYNRRGFYAGIEKLINTAREQRLFLIIYSIDLNGLKYINDFYGHQEGDFAIRQLALALETAAMDDTLCSRFGGDEFIVAMLSPDAEKESISYCMNVKDYLNRVNAEAGKPYDISASFGVSYCIPDAAFRLDRLIFQADEKMYQEKEHSPHFRGVSNKKKY